MRRRAPLTALVLLAAASAARAAVTLDERAVQDWGNLPGGGYHGSVTEVSSPVGRDGIYSLSARVDQFRSPQLFDGWNREYSAGLARELYHVTVKGRLGTAPPGAMYPATVAGARRPGQIRPAYHLAGGEMVFTLYGTELGPERPELSSLVWESSGPAPDPASLDRAWVTRFRMIYTNTDFHIELPSSVLIVVQNAWQFTARETWRDRVSLAVSAGGDRYSKDLPHSAPKIGLDNVDYYGAPGAIFGWPNNYVGAAAWAVLRPGWRVEAGFTRLNLLDNELLFMYAAGVEWRPNAHWKVAPQLLYSFRRNTGARPGAGLDAAYSF